jgi:multidrug efflux pump subunit AcrA (membrane-fusion protein)
VSSAKSTRTTTLTKDRQAISSAEQQVASAQLSAQTTAANNAVKQAPPTAATLAQLRAAVLQAQATVVTARKAVTGTVLRAPEAGLIASVSGVPGATVAAGGMTSTSAASTASSSSSSSGSSGGSSSSFVTMLGSGMEVTAEFSESDAAKVQVGQPATVTVSALPGRELAAHVISVGVVGSSSSGVVEYPVVFAVDRSIPQLKSGMSANVSVTVSERDNVLNVPSAAVTGSGSNARVTVVANGVQSTVPVVAGLKGDTTTEIVSGVKAGQEVVTSTGATLFSSGSSLTGGTSTTSTSSTGRARFGGGGGAFFGGGGGFGGP